MSEPIIEVRNLSKRYRLGQLGARSLREDLDRWWHRLRKRPNGNVGAENFNGSSGNEFWALKGISFEVKPGEVVGVIGKNGAGKSTLLKILSRITLPTSGDARLHGRVASLLEVGTGFHPELTGRENVFLNGAVLGMRKSEVAAKFDEIVAFSEIEKFIDTPVKRYSSGMYVRLAFAVAAHLEPEILIVDEVLAVGDAAFQRKCLGKMHDVSRAEGRTILFVSHNMHAIERLCSRCLLLNDGRIQIDTNETRTAIEGYHLSSEEQVGAGYWECTDLSLFENPWFDPNRMYLSNSIGELVAGPFQPDDEVWIAIEGNCRDSDDSLQIGYGLFDSDGELLFWSTNRDADPEQWDLSEIGTVRWRSQLPLRMLNEGEYRIDLFLGLFHRQWVSEPGRTTASLKLQLFGGLSSSPYWPCRRPGTLAPMTQWSLCARSKS